MKIFLSWSGELSKQIADSINKWFPCILQSVQIFYSPEDIEKGDNWDQKITSVLSESNYGIICLTSENVTAPWINFEAGAIAKALNSHVATLMININPSDIKGPLSRYQATKLIKGDLLRLVQDINSGCDNPIENGVLETTFNALWGSIEKDFFETLKKNGDVKKETKKATENKNAEAIEEILQLVRKQNSVLSSPDVLFPREYFEYLMEKMPSKDREVIGFFLDSLERTYNRLIDLPPDMVKLVFMELGIVDYIRIIEQFISRRDRSTYRRYSEIRRKFESMAMEFAEMSRIV